MARTDADAPKTGIFERFLVGTDPALAQAVTSQPRFDALSAFAVAFAAGPLLLVAPAEVVASWLAGLVLFPLGRRRLFVALVTGVALVVAGTRARDVEKELLAARALLPRTAARCEAVAEVVASPVEAHGSFRWIVDLRARSCEGVAARRELANVRAALYSDVGDVARGDVLEVVAELAPPEEIWNFETGDPRPSAARRGVLLSGGVVSFHRIERGRGVLAAIDRLRAHARRRIVASFDPDVAPMARALVLGEADLADADDRAFRASGLAHLLAVSGAHLVIVVVGLLALSRAIVARIPAISSRIDAGRVVAAPGIALSFLYADFAGGSGSALRAAWMLSFVLAARALGRRGDGPRAFALSLLSMTWIDPLAAFDMSFVLSVAATAGLFASSNATSAWIAARVPRPLAKIARGVAASVGAGAACAPVLARFAPSLPGAGTLANLFAVPVGELAALPLCLFHGILAPWPAAERGCAVLASGALRIVLFLARRFAASAVGVPMLTSWQVAAAAAFLVALALLRGPRRVVTVLACAAVFLLAEVSAVRAGARRGSLRVSFLDVGQGDSALVDFPDGKAMLVDAGGLVGSSVDIGERVIAPVLRARRRSSIDLVVLSHPHPDHFGGLAAGLAAMQVGTFWDTGQGARENVAGGYAAFRARLEHAGVHIAEPAEFCGDRELGGVVLRVLAPCPAYDPDRGPNDNSIVLQLRYGRRTFLFVGDAEAAEERDLLARGADLRADVLKVGHHGSRTSTSEAFLRAVAPSDAVISVGARNRFGHPARATLGALERAGVRVWRTDRNGEVRVETDGEKLEISAVHGDSTR